MEQDWSLIDEIEDDAPISEHAALLIRESAASGCLICTLDSWEDE
jgi:hypothetical protein